MSSKHTHSGNSNPTIAWLWLLTAALILALLGTGRINNYVQTFWRPALAVAAIFVLIVTVSDLWVYYRGRTQFRTPASHSGRSATTHVANRTPWFAWFLVAPLALIILAAPSPLGAAMLANAVSGSTTYYPRGGGNPPSDPSDGYWQPQVGAKFQGGLDVSPLHSDAVNQLTLEQLSDRFNLGDSRDLWGKKISVIGFVSHDMPPDAYGDIGQRRQPGQPVAGYQLNRFKIFCCAADAIAYSVLIVSDQDIPDNTWLQIEGSVVPDPSLNAVFIRPTKVQRITQPEVPYL